jgi:leucyl-tRNA synthetase
MTDDDLPYVKEAGLTMALLLQPFAPHISEEIWERLGGQGSAVRRAWPVASSRWLQEDRVEIPVQVNGRLRGRLLVAASLSEAEVLSRARNDVNVAAHLEGRTIRKTIYLPGRLLNIVVG